VCRGTPFAVRGAAGASYRTLLFLVQINAIVFQKRLHELDHFLDRIVWLQHRARDSSASAGITDVHRFIRHAHHSL